MKKKKKNDTARNDNIKIAYTVHNKCFTFVGYKL